MPGRQREAYRFVGPELASLRNSPHPLRDTKPRTSQPNGSSAPGRLTTEFRRRLRANVNSLSSYVPQIPDLD